MPWGKKARNALRLKDESKDFLRRLLNTVRCIVYHGMSLRLPVDISPPRPQPPSQSAFLIWDAFMSMVPLTLLVGSLPHSQAPMWVIKSTPPGSQAKRTAPLECGGGNWDM